MLTYSKTSYSENPFLSIITRKYKRPIGFNKNQESIQSLIDKDIEQIFITDHKGLGLFAANTSFGNRQVREMITGKYVFLLDDDDFIVNPYMVSELIMVHAEFDPDVIFFRMNIIGGPNGDLYPTPNTWEKEPVIAQIGGSCFVVKREIYLKHIHEFAKARCGDFAFIKSVFESGAKCFWHDSLMCQTGKISRGKPE